MATDLLEHLLNGRTGHFGPGSYELTGQVTNPVGLFYFDEDAVITVSELDTPAILAKPATNDDVLVIEGGRWDFSAMKNSATGNQPHDTEYPLRNAGTNATNDGIRVERSVGTGKSWRYLKIGGRGMHLSAGAHWNHVDNGCDSLLHVEATVEHMGVVDVGGFTAEGARDLAVYVTVDGGLESFGVVHVHDIGAINCMAGIGVKRGVNGVCILQRLTLDNCPETIKVSEIGTDTPVATVLSDIYYARHNVGLDLDGCEGLIGQRIRFGAGGPTDETDTALTGTLAGLTADVRFDDTTDCTVEIPLGATATVVNANNPTNCKVIAGRPTWLSGAGAPAATDGVDGDFYLDTTNDDYYGPKAAGAWGAATSMVGPTGATGPAGADGADGADGSTLIFDAHTSADTGTEITTTAEVVAYDTVHYEKTASEITLTGGKLSSPPAGTYEYRFVVNFVPLDQVGGQRTGVTLEIHEDDVEVNARRRSNAYVREIGGGSPAVASVIIVNPGVVHAEVYRSTDDMHAEVSYATVTVTRL